MIDLLIMCRFIGNGQKQRRNFIWNSWRRIVPVCLPRSYMLTALTVWLLIICFHCS